METLPFFGFKISFWGGIRVHILFFNIGFMTHNAEASNKNLEFGLTFGIDSDFPSSPDVFLSIPYFSTCFRLLPRFVLKQESYMQHDDTDLTVSVEGLQIIKRDVLVFSYTHFYSFLGIDFERKSIKLMFTDEPLVLKNTFTGLSLNTYGIVLKKTKTLTDYIQDRSLIIELPSIYIDPTKERFITSFDV